MQPEYEVFAIRYATREARRHEHFIGGDPHDGPMPMDYFGWVARNADRVVVIDIGFTAESGGKRGRTLTRDPIDADADRCRRGAGEGRDPDAYALRPCWQLPPLPCRAIPFARAGDVLRRRPLHAP